MMSKHLKESTEKKKRRNRIYVRCGTCIEMCVVRQPTSLHPDIIDIPFGWSLLKKDSFGRGEGYSMHLIIQCPDCRMEGRKHK